LEERKQLTGVRLTEQLGGSTARHPPTTIPPSQDRNKCDDLDGLPNDQPACDNTPIAANCAPTKHVLARTPVRARPRKPPLRRYTTAGRAQDRTKPKAPEDGNLYASPTVWTTPSPNKKNVRCLCDMPRSAVRPKFL